ncbi:hypothetical protein [Frigoriflavimonas asaccharolytica]|uniref:Uncharacterized protein n=1 Tax=Frigoriflavimonas asaccharolytica TaxID=2735899 RepID=A0A8J8K9X9_9FLAO|nr:hypothetical protein [Frigoriflavimonas asaccharolytica]NRS93572.1 hypothetical protein [Frigoriflavimonas asaccharolytica]
MRKFLQVSIFIISITSFSQTLTDKIVQSAANNIKSEDYQTALTILSEADQNDYRVSYMQIISRFSLLKNLQDKTNAEASKYISKFGNKNSNYTKSVSQILSNINNTTTKIPTVDEVNAEPLSVSPFVPIKYGSDVADFIWLGKKSKKLFISPNYAIIKNPKSISEFLGSYENNNGMSFFKGKINFCHFYEINSENIDGTGQRKMLDLRNGQIYDVPAKILKCANNEDQEFENNSNVYIIKKCEDGKNGEYVYEWDEYFKYFNLVKSKTN